MEIFEISSSSQSAYGNLQIRFHSELSRLEIKRVYSHISLLICATYRLCPTHMEFVLYDYINFLEVITYDEMITNSLHRLLGVILVAGRYGQCFDEKIGGVVVARHRIS